MDSLPLHLTKWTDRLAFDVALCLEGSGESLDEIKDRHRIDANDLLVFNRDPVFLKRVETYRSQVAIDELKMAASIKGWADIYKPRLVCFDKYATQTIADRLGASGVMVEDVSGQQFYKACGDLLEGLVNHRVVHNGQAQYCACLESGLQASMPIQLTFFLDWSVVDCGLGLVYTKGIYHYS